MTHPFRESLYLFYLLLFSCFIFDVNSYLDLYNSRFRIEEWYYFETAESGEATIFSSATFPRTSDSMLCNRNNNRVIVFKFRKVHSYQHVWGFF